MIGAMKPDSTVLYVNKAILDYTGFLPMILVSLTTSQVCRAASGWDRRFQLYPWPHTKRSGEGGGTTRKVTHGVSLQTALNLDPFMIHEMFLCLTETAFGSHPCRVVSVTYRKLRPFHGNNRHRRCSCSREGRQAGGCYRLEKRRGTDTRDAPAPRRSTSRVSGLHQSSTGIGCIHDDWGSPGCLHLA